MLVERQLSSGRSSFLLNVNFRYRIKKIISSIEVIMPFFDFPLEQLQAYIPECVEQPDFDAFWEETLSATRQFPLGARFEMVETYDLTFNGYGGQPIKGWLILPAHRSSPLPGVVEVLGYSPRPGADAFFKGIVEMTENG
jgi:cephalosporin-C deacetylase-like acetyl esterase